MVADDQTHTLPSDREGARALRALRRLQGSRRLRRDAARPSAQGAGATTSSCSRTRRRRPSRLALSFPKDATTARRSTGSARWASSKPLEVSATVRHWLSGSYPALRGEFARTQFAELVPVLLDRLARAENPDAAISAPSTHFIGGIEPRRAAVLAAAAESRPGDAGGADARHRAAARRHPGAPSRGDGRAARADVFRRACRTRPSSKPTLARSAGRIAHLRGLSRPAAHVQPGADVPDRRAHPVGHGVGRAGRRRLRPARRRGDPRAAPPRRGDASPKATAASAASRPRCSRSASSAAAR